MEKKKKGKRKRKKERKSSKNYIAKKIRNKKRKKKKNVTRGKRKRILNIIIATFAILTLASFILLHSKKNNELKIMKEIEETIIPKSEKNEYSIEEENEISKLKTYYSNDDIKAILTISDSDFSIPIVRGNDNNYYLSHSISKEKSAIGSIFMDYRNSTDSKQINIYGHNSEDYNPPLKILENYFNKSYFNNHKYIELKLENEIKKYEIFSVYISEKSSGEEHMQFNYTSNSEWLNHYKRIQKRSLYNTNSQVNENDNILILQTCVYGEYKGKLLIVAAKEIKNV